MIAFGHFMLAIGERYAMPDYKCCLLDTSDMVIAVDTIQSEDDVRAMVLAAHLIVRKYPSVGAIEVWNETHRVGRINNPKLPVSE